MAVQVALFLSLSCSINLLWLKVSDALVREYL